MAQMPINGQWEDVVAQHGPQLVGHNVVVIVLDRPASPPMSRAERDEAWAALQEKLRSLPPLRWPVTRQEMYEE
jgi:hypothetical protein